MDSSKYPELSPERIADALDGDRVAFSDMFRCYAPTVRASVAAALRFRPSLQVHFEDIVSEVWTRFLADGCKRLRSYDPGRGPFGYYLRMRTYALARMLAAQYLRRSKTVDLADPFLALFGDEGFEGQLLGRDALDKLYAAVRERLGEADVAIFEQVYVKGRRILDVGEELGMSKDAVYRRSHRLRDKLLAIAEDLGAGSGLGQPVASLAVLVAFVAQFGHMGEDPRIVDGLSDRPSARE